MAAPDVGDIKNHWDTLIIGGGITGIGIFRDLCLHSQEALLVDRGDFSSQTSSASSKMLHGGIRYLEHGNFALVREALGEKTLWCRLAGHLVKERAFILPVYTHSPRPLWQVRAGLFLYGLLSGFRHRSHGVLNPQDVLARLPGLETQGLLGAGLYYDAVMDDARMALEILYDALERHRGNRALGHTALADVFLRDDHSYGCLLRDTLTGREKSITCRYLVVAAGPFTDRLLGSFPFIRWQPVLHPSKGSHFYLRQKALPLKEATVLTVTRGRVLFVIPQGEKVLVGTTEVSPREDDFTRPTMEKGERDSLLNQVRDYFPGASVSREDILSDFSGIRPLVRSRGVRHEDTSSTSRRHHIYRPRSTLFVVVGGKYTTFRIMARDVVGALFRKKGLCYRPHLSLSPLLKKSVVSSPGRKAIGRGEIEKIIETEFPRNLDDLIIRRLGVGGPRELPQALGETLARTPMVQTLAADRGMRQKWGLL